MNALVAGGAGLIGRPLVDGLLARGEAGAGLATRATGRRRHPDHHAAEPLLTVSEADITAPLPVNALAGPFARIYQLASPASPADYMRLPVETLLVNSLGTWRLL